MGYAQFVGRVGALAVALGVTNVVGHPLVAWAEEPSAESSTKGGAEPAPSTGTPDKPAETQSADPTTAPSHEPVDTEEDAPEPEAPDIEETQTEETEVSEVETPDPTTPPAPETEEAQAPETDPTTVEVPETKDPHPSEVEQAATPPADDNDDADQSRFVARALTVSGIDEQSLDAPLPIALAIPVSADLVTSSAAPTAAVTITKVDPVTVEETHPFRSLVLGFLGIFGFDPTPGATNDALLASLWAAYRGYERRFENESPTVSGATVLSTSQTENGYTAVTISVGFTDPDGDTLHFTTTNGHAGTLTNNNDGTYTYKTLTPGVDTVTITANDDDGTGHLHGLLGWLFKPNAGHTRTVTLSLDVTAPPANHAPVATDDTATTNEDSPVVIHVLTNDSDADNDPLSIAGHTVTTRGTLTLNNDGTFTYAPNENYNGTDEFSYTTTDGQATSNTATVHITINPVNDTPVAVDDTRTVVAGTSYTFTAAQLLANDTDVDGDTLAVHSVGNPTGGTVVLNGNGTVTFTPSVGSSGSGSFTYTSADPAGAVSAAATVTIVASTDPVVVDTIATGSTRPTWITFSADGAHAYTANRGNDTVSVYDTTTRAEITDIALPPGSEPLNVNTGPDGKIYVANRSAGNVIVIDPTTNSIVNTITTGGRPLGVNFATGIAYVTLGDANGVKAYDINDDYALVQTYTQGTDGWPSRTAVTPDGRLYISNQITNSVSVVDRTTGDLISTISGIGFATVIELDEADHLAFVSAQTANQVAVIDTRTDTLLRYIPTGSTPIGLQVDDATNTGYVVNFNGGYEGAENPGSVWVLDLATGEAISKIDVGTGSVSATLTPDHRQLWVASEGSGITIIDLPAATNRSPVAVGDSVTTNQDTAVTIAVLTNDSDPDGDPLSVGSFTQGAHGTVTLNVDGTFTYAPGESYYGTDEFSYTITDGTLSSYGAAVHVTVNQVVNPPIAVDDAVTTNEDTSVVIDVLANDTGGALTITAVSQPGHGGAAINADGTVTYTPAADYNGDDEFTYTVDNGTTPSQGTVTVTVNPVDDPPVIQSVVTTALSATSWRITVTAYDPDGDPLDITLTPTDPDHVTITPEMNLLSARMFSLAAFDADPQPTTVNYIAEVDPDYAAAHPGQPVGATVGVTDGNGPEVTQQQQVATITNMIGFGDRNGYGLVDIPAAPVGLSYTKIVVGLANSVALLSDGTAVLYGITAGGMFQIPDLPANLTYTDAAYPDIFTILLLRSDGSLVAAGSPGPLAAVPAAPAGVTYTGIVGTVGYTALMRSDGAVTLVNVNDSSSEVYTAGGGLTYTQAAVGSDHVVLLRSDGAAVAYHNPNASGGPNTYGQLDIPALPSGMTYTQVGAGDSFTVLLRSDGTVLTFGKKPTDYVDLPPLPPGTTYTAIAAGNSSALALRSDGAVVQFGTGLAHSAIPDLPAGTVYTQIYAGLDSASVAATARTTALAAIPDQASANEDTPVTVTVLANDVDPDGNPLTVTAVTPGLHGTTAINADGTITYTPDADYYGADSFAYTVSNGVTSSAAGVTVRLASTPDAPRAQDAVYEVAAGSVLYVNMADKVYDPPDPLVLPYDGTPQLEIATPPSLGTAEFTNRSYLNYTAPTDLGGATSTTFTYYGNDVWSHGNIATVTINFV